MVALQETTSSQMAFERLNGSIRLPNQMTLLVMNGGHQAWGNPWRNVEMSKLPTA